MKILIIKVLRHIILNFFSILLFTGIFLAPTIIFPGSVSAADGCTYVGQCVNNQKCACNSNITYVCRFNPSALYLTSEPCGSAIIGGVEPPPAVAAINSASGSDIGIIFFASRIITVANIIAGILVMFNFVSAGFLYITGADSSQNMSKINDSLMWSVIGVLVIVGSYSFAALFGLIFYGDPTFIITPTLTGAI